MRASAIVWSPSLTETKPMIHRVTGENAAPEAVWVSPAGVVTTERRADCGRGGWWRSHKWPTGQETTLSPGAWLQLRHAKAIATARWCRRCWPDGPP